MSYTTDSVKFEICVGISFFSLMWSWTWWHSKNIIHCSTTDWSVVENSFPKPLVRPWLLLPRCSTPGRMAGYRAVPELCPPCPAVANGYYGFASDATAWRARWRRRRITSNVRRRRRRRPAQARPGTLCDRDAVRWLHYHRRTRVATAVARPPRPPTANIGRHTSCRCRSPLTRFYYRFNQSPRVLYDVLTVRISLPKQSQNYSRTARTDTSLSSAVNRRLRHRGKNCVP